MIADGTDSRRHLSFLEALPVSDYTLLWAIVLLLVSLGLLVLETFIPSWGILGFFAAVSA